MKSLGLPWCKMPAAAVALAAFAGLALLEQPGLAQESKPERILFASLKRDDKASAIYSMSPDGSRRTKLTKGDTLVMDPSVSPDSKQVAFVEVNIPERKSDLHIMNADGSGRKQLTKTDPLTLAFAPNWSPDGKRITYYTVRREGFGPPKDTSLFVIDADGRNQKRLASGIMPAWSSDGKRLLYTVIDTTQGVNFSLHVMDADGKNPRVLVKNRAMMGTWSPDGKRIAYVGLDGGDIPDIFVMNADGSQSVQLTKTEGEVEVAPRWSADGKHIYCNRTAVKGPPESAFVVVMDADGRNLRQINQDGTLDLLGGAGFFFVGTVLRVLQPPP